MIGRILLIVCFIFLSANQVVALSYKNLPENIQENTFLPSQSLLTEANLLQVYISRYQEKIYGLSLTYESGDAKILKDANNAFDKMNFVLEKIKAGTFGENDAQLIMSSIVTDLKILNEYMKRYFDDLRRIYEKELAEKQQQLSQITGKIVDILDNLIDRLSSILLAKDSLTPSEKSIVAHLINLRNENQKLEQFAKMQFSSQEEMQSYIQESIGNIRREILAIKQLSRR